ncbi:MAG: NAD-dependent protein deacylase, partial [Ignavibacteria bacterium]|nr:NAD-dependent protein deacylase [Ignavibacteria bacterium]
YKGGESVSFNRDIFFVVGTSAVVYPAAGLVYSAKQGGAAIVEINIEQTEISSIADYSFYGESGKVLPEILDAYKSAAGKE